MFTLVRSDEFDTWMRKLKDRTAKPRILSRLARLESGQFGDFTVIDPDLLELRLHFGPGYRVYILRDGDQLIVLLCGGDKSSQQRDIGKAREIAHDWLIMKGKP